MPPIATSRRWMPPSPPASTATTIGRAAARSARSAHRCSAGSENFEGSPVEIRAQADQDAGTTALERPREADGLRLPPRLVEGRGTEIGRASCRERVCQEVEISVVVVQLKKQKTFSKTKSY